jgi:hypothetical protein
MRVLVALMIFVLASFPVLARDLRIATWNLGAPWDGNIESGEYDFRKASQEVGADIYVLQEVNSLLIAKRIAELLKVPSPDIAVSDFSPPSGAEIFFSLETAVISSVPILRATELEFSRNDQHGPLVNDSAIAVSRGRLKVPQAVSQTFDEGIEDGLRGSRGALRVELANRLIIYAVHAKSERSNYCAALQDAAIKINQALEPQTMPAGSAEAIQSLTAALEALKALAAAEEETSFSREWIRNAQKREALFASLADKVAEDVKAGFTVAVMGDFNIPINDPRSGKSIAPEDECNPTRSCSMMVEDRKCGGKDGLDDSHFLISGGLRQDLKMRPLTKDLTVTLTGAFASAIDHIYVAGPNSDRFSLADTRQDGGGKGFGSDHLPVITTFRESN